MEDFFNKYKCKFIRYFNRSQNRLGLIILIMLIIFVVIPLCYVVYQSFVFGPSAKRLIPGAIPGHFTLYNWLRIFFSRISTSVLYIPFLHSFEIATGVTILSLTLGSILAWIVVRTDIQFKSFISSIIIIPYILPSWTPAMAWLVVFKNERIGGIPGLLTYLFGIQPPNWISYGFIPIVASLTIHYIPYTFIIVSAALTSIDSQLEEMGEVLGASRFKILRRLTFPIVLPAIGSAFILTFSKGLGEFTCQAFLGLPVRYYTLSTQIYSSFSNRLLGIGYSLSLILVGVAALTVYFNYKIIGTRREYVTMGGKGVKMKLTPLGKWRKLITGFIFLLIILFIFAPMFLLGWQILMKYEGNYGLNNLTLHYLIGESNFQLAEGIPGILRNPLIIGAAWNTIKLAGITALISGILGMLLGYVIVRNRGSALSKLIENLAFVPYMIPGIAFGGIFLTLFGRSWGFLPSIYGTLTLLVLACVVKRLPYSSRAGISAMMQIDSSLEEAAEVQGVSWFRRFSRIIVPLAKSGFTSGVLLTFITTVRILSEIVLLVTPRTSTLTSVMFRYQNQEFTQHAYGILFIIIIITLVGTSVIRKFGGKMSL